MSINTTAATVDSRGQETQWTSWTGQNTQTHTSSLEKMLQFKLGQAVIKSLESIIYIYIYIYIYIFILIIMFLNEYFCIARRHKLMKYDSKPMILFQNIPLKKKKESWKKCFQFPQTYWAAQLLLTFSWAPNQHIRMISEGSHDTEDGSNDAENFCITEINYIFKYIQTQNCHLNCNNISQ